MTKSVKELNEIVQELIDFEDIEKSEVADDEIDIAKIMYKEIQEKINPIIEEQDIEGPEGTFKALYDELNFADGFDVTNDLDDILLGHSMILTYEKDDIVIEVTIDELDNKIALNPYGTVIANGNILSNIGLSESIKK